MNQFLIRPSCHYRRMPRRRRMKKIDVHLSRNNFVVSWQITYSVISYCRTHLVLQVQSSQFLGKTSDLCYVKSWHFANCQLASEQSNKRCFGDGRPNATVLCRQSENSSPYTPLLLFTCNYKGVVTGNFGPPYFKEYVILPTEQNWHSLLFLGKPPSSVGGLCSTENIYNLSFKNGQPKEICSFGHFLCSSFH